VHRAFTGRHARLVDVTAACSRPAGRLPEAVGSTSPSRSGTACSCLLLAVRTPTGPDGLSVLTAGPGLHGRRAEECALAPHWPAQGPHAVSGGRPPAPDCVLR
jgi:hypothetical protein